MKPVLNKSWTAANLFLSWLKDTARSNNLQRGRNGMTHRTHLGTGIKHLGVPCWNF